MKKRKQKILGGKTILASKFLESGHFFREGVSLNPLIADGVKWTCPPLN